VRAGEKFADADLLGIPYRVVVSEKTLTNQQFEIKKRGESEAKFLSREDLINIVSDNQGGLL
jgi:prolyl-tRNA synthetase